MTSMEPPTPTTCSTVSRNSRMFLLLSSWPMTSRRWWSSLERSLRTGRLNSSTTLRWSTNKTSRHVSLNQTWRRSMQSRAVIGWLGLLLKARWWPGSTMLTMSSDKGILHGSSGTSRLSTRRTTCSTMRRSRTALASMLPRGLFQRRQIPKLQLLEQWETDKIKCLSQEWLRMRMGY